jgi:ligand-binding SRPBCC domain-containing protein
MNSGGYKWSLGMLGGFSSNADTTLVGGFGGGSGCSAGNAAGGAGGYSGGGGQFGYSAGSGGGSFTTSSFSGTNITATRGFNSDHGSVAVTLISITASYVTRPSTQNANEGTTVTFRTNTVGVANTTLYYTISGSAGINNFDFTDNALTGSFNTVSGVGTTAKTLSNDLSSNEGTESFYMNISTGSTLGPVVTTSPIVYVYDTSNATFNITPSVSFLNEGSSVGFAVTTTNIPDNTTAYYTISGSAGISTTDFTDGALSGSFNIVSNSATVTKTLVDDLSSNEGTETFNMSIRVGSTSGQIATTSSNIAIYDVNRLIISKKLMPIGEGVRSLN